jgi:hypothetical protein
MENSNNGKSIIYSEAEMEKYLESKGHGVNDSEGCTDSVEVIEIALSLGFESLLNSKRQAYVFVKHDIQGVIKQTKCPCGGEMEHVVDSGNFCKKCGMQTYIVLCDNCSNVIQKQTGLGTVDSSDYTVCDTCEATICTSCIGEQNECPICKEELTSEENF